jgi:hypothetical protein
VALQASGAMVIFVGILTELSANAHRRYRSFDTSE